jgi:hypothetical protein
VVTVKVLKTVGFAKLKIRSLKTKDNLASFCHFFYFRRVGGPERRGWSEAESKAYRAARKRGLGSKAIKMQEIPE